MKPLMCMHAQEVFISNKIYKKPVTFFKMVIKNGFITKCNEKICLKRIIL